MQYKSAKTAKEMLEAVCEDLEYQARFWAKECSNAHSSASWRDFAFAKQSALDSRTTEYRAILKEME